MFVVFMVMGYIDGEDMRYFEGLVCFREFCFYFLWLKLLYGLLCLFNIYMDIGDLNCVFYRWLVFVELLSYYYSFKLILKFGIFVRND